MTDAELLTLRAALAERAALKVEDRIGLPTPDAAQNSIAGALYWVIKRYWQDRPLILIAGLCFLGLQIGTAALQLLR